jgi:hypothetical protein
MAQDGHRRLEIDSSVAMDLALSKRRAKAEGFQV